MRGGVGCFGIVGGNGGTRQVPPEGSLPVPILTDDHPILADLGVSILLGQGEAEVPCAVGIGGIVLPGSGGADNV
jgi:hypothetical protein